MVYCGKPSKACAACRQKKTRCDKGVPSCGQCVRANRTCPGYRNQLDLMFRSENDAVIGKTRVRDSTESRANSPLPTTGTSFTPRTTEAGASIPLTSNWENIFETALGFEGSNDSQYYINDADDFASSLAINPAIAPTLEERARGYFSSNSLMWLRNHDLVDELCRGGSDSEPLLASVSAVGMASFANTIQGPKLLNRARKDYVKALRLTNAALRSPTEVKKDSTLFSVVILSLFEMVAGCNEHSLEAWNEHINGASALIKLRGVEQFNTRAGQRLFMQVTSNVMVSCTQRTLPIPEHIVELRQVVEKLMAPSTWHGGEISAVIFDFAKLRAAIREGEIVGPRAVIEAALEVDRKLLKAFQKVPESWQYRTFYSDHDDENIWNRRYDIYNDNSSLIIQVWNGMRTCRILLHETIRDQLLAASSAMTQIFSEEESKEQEKESILAMLTMQADILASVPSHPAPNPHERPSAFAERSRGYFILWPLYMAGVMDLATQPITTWVIRQLRKIAIEVGIGQANVLADVLEKHQLIASWRTKPTPRSKKDGAFFEWTTESDSDRVSPEWWDIEMPGDDVDSD